jgi:hypothetical protein
MGTTSEYTLSDQSAPFHSKVSGKPSTGWADKFVVERCVFKWFARDHSRILAPFQLRTEKNALSKLLGGAAPKKQVRTNYKGRKNSCSAYSCFAPPGLLIMQYPTRGSLALPCDYYRVPDNIVTDSSHDCAYIWPRKRARRARKSPFQCSPCLLLWRSLWAVLRHSNVAIKCDSL